MTSKQKDTLARMAELGGTAVNWEGYTDWDLRTMVSLKRRGLVGQSQPTDSDPGSFFLTEAGWEVIEEGEK